MEPLLADPTGQAARRRRPPARGPPSPRPLHGGPLTLLRFMHANNMLNRHYARLLVRWPG